VAASGAAGAALVTRGRVRAAAMLAAIALAPVVVAGDVWDTQRLEELRDSPARMAAAVAVSAAVVAALTWLVLRWPVALPLLALAALPVRVPIDLGGEDANLLVPLYAVIAAGVAASAIRAFREPPGHSGQQNEGGSSGLESVAVRALPWLLAAFLLVYALQGAYSDNFSKAIENVGFFFIPFAVLLALLSRITWTADLLKAALAVVVAEALVFAIVGYGQFVTEHVFWNPEVIAANEVHTYFRVNSLFWDPNVLGRYLVLAILALAACMVWASTVRLAGAAAASCAVILGAVALTFSQSSLVALLAGIVALAGVRWGTRWALAAIALGAVSAAGLVALSGADIGSEESLDIRSSGRAGLVRGGLDLATDRPLQGYGSGAYQTEFKARFPEEAEGTGAVSHTEPVTVAAEQGTVGIFLYVAMLAAGLVALLAARSGGAAARGALVACFVAMVVHSLAYAGLMIDPATWALLGMGLALAGRPAPIAVPAPARPAHGGPRPAGAELPAS
jgi:putative inorganic carbon (HCO3(-)) transporter